MSETTRHEITRRPIAAANWKMHKLRADAKDFGRTFVAELGAPVAEVLLFPSFPLLDTVVDSLAGTPVGIGGQDVHAAEAGAHTGDVSAAQLADAGCTWALCGHSERRADHREADEAVGAKAAAAVASGLVPLVCVGETAEEREAGRTFEVLARQLRGMLAGAGGPPAEMVLAYEPIWAIGTGATATPQLAQEAHAFLRGELASQVDSTVAAGTRLLYGGSVKPDNAADLIAQDDIDGFLVGGASLDVRSFLAIIRCCGAP